jgi:PAS domain S-box-containing protein
VRPHLILTHKSDFTCAEMKKKVTKKEVKVPVGRKRKKSTLVRKKKEDNPVNYELLLKSVPGLYLILDSDFTIVAVNDAYLNATMTQRESIVGHALFEIFPDNPDDHTADGVSNLRASLAYVLKHKKPHTMAVQKYDIRTPNGVFEVRYWSPINTPVLNAKNEVVYIIHNVTDVTEHQTRDEKLKKSENDYQLLVENVKDYAIFMIDTKGCVASWNSGAESIKGYTAKEIIGKPIEVFYTADEIRRNEPKRNLQMAMQHGHYETEGWRLRKNGTLFYANIVFNSLYDQSGNHYGFAKVTRDITEKRKAEEHIRFLATMANNIKIPLLRLTIIFVLPIGIKRQKNCWAGHVKR